MKNSATGTPEPQSALDKIKIVENHDPLEDLRGIPGLVFRSDPGKQVTPFLRKPVAAMLAHAALKLAPHFNLYVISALRSMSQQQEIWDHQLHRIHTSHPNWPEHIVRRAANKYAAPTDHPAPPGHCTGAAVDVALQRPDGSFVDLIPPYIEDWSLAHTWTNKIDAETKGYRMVLVEAMLSVGFSNCRDEYWHYSWGDSGWAVREGKKECFYGIVEVPEYRK